MTCRQSMEEASEIEEAYIQASFSTKNVKYSIPKTSFSIPVTADREDLSSLINQLLQAEDSGDEEKRTHEFDFFINSELVRGSLGDHINKRSIPVENVINIEYSDRNPPPSLSDVFDHNEWVSCVHCNKKFILSGSYDNIVRVWSLDGVVQSEGNGHTGPIKDVKWITTVEDTDAHVDEQGLLFLSASQDQNIHLWKFQKPSQSANDSGDGDGNNVADSAILLHQFKGHARSVDSLAVSPNKQEFCSVSWDTYLKIWSAVPDSSPLDEVEDEDTLVSKKRKIGSSHHATTRTPLVTLQGHTQPATGVVWAEPGEIVSAGWDMCIRVWDVTTGSNTTTLSGPKAFHDIDKSQLNQLIASANSDKYVRLWDQRSSETSMMKSILSSHGGWVVSVCWSPSDHHQLLSASYDSTLRLWDIRSPKQPLYTITAHEGKVLCCDWTIPDLLVSGGEDNKLRTFSYNTQS